IVRAMPNTASAIRAGVTCVCGAELPQVEALLDRVGTVVRLEERLMDAATAVSGVAPAYVALLAEAWIDAAVGQGIPAAQAAMLVGGALSGSAALLQARGMDTLGVRREVTSPGGMTARGLRVLEQAGLRSAFADAAAAVAGPSTT
ncbi:MAG: pyrroline-5-carboxylate reductase dimerization domain-containing protein, partial [Solirubrobacteraceae bacterium]